MRSLLVSALVAMVIAAGLVVSIYDALEISKEDAKKCLLLSISEGLLNRGNHSDLVMNARKLSVAERLEGIKQLMQLAKAYTASEDFKKDYKKWRNEQLNPGSKTKLGLPKFGKIISNKIDNELDKSKNEDKYPKDAQELVKKRLTRFLAVSETVDFDAQLTPGRSFANPEYEKKSAEWKQCYRAGKEVVEAARIEAQKWLNELE